MLALDGSVGTDGDTNGVGNLIVGYDENNSNDKTGSHNLVVGKYHTYSSYAGLVAGYDNNVTGANASVSGETANTASGEYSSVSGGFINTASGTLSSVSGGDRNTASGQRSSASGGYGSVASGDHSSVSGGHNREAPGDNNWAAGSLSEGG